MKMIRGGWEKKFQLCLEGWLLLCAGEEKYFSYSPDERNTLCVSLRSSISFWFSFGKLYFSKNLSISSKLFILLA